MKSEEIKERQAKERKRIERIVEETDGVLHMHKYTVQGQDDDLIIRCKQQLQWLLSFITTITVAIIIIVAIIITIIIVIDLPTSLVALLQVM